MIPRPGHKVSACVQTCAQTARARAHTHFSQIIRKLYTTTKKKKNKEIAVPVRWFSCIICSWHLVNHHGHSRNCTHEKLCSKFSQQPGPTPLPGGCCIATWITPPAKVRRGWQMVYLSNTSLTHGISANHSHTYTHTHASTHAHTCAHVRVVHIITSVHFPMYGHCPHLSSSHAPPTSPDLSTTC